MLQDFWTVLVSLIGAWSASGIGYFWWEWKWCHSSYCELCSCECSWSRMLQQSFLMMCTVSICMFKKIFSHNRCNMFIHCKESVPSVSYVSESTKMSLLWNTRIWIASKQSLLVACKILKVIVKPVHMNVQETQSSKWVSTNMTLGRTYLCVQLSYEYTIFPNLQSNYHNQCICLICNSYIRNMHRIPIKS